MSDENAGWGFKWGGGWTVAEDKAVTKVRAKKKGGLPKEVLENYDVWKATIRSSGLDGLGHGSGYRHEKLGNNLDGLFSSRLGKRYRVVYTVDECARKVFVEKVDTHHRAYRGRK